MKAGCYIRKTSLKGDPRTDMVLDRLREGGFDVYEACGKLESGTDMLLSIGGDGTFLSAARLASREGVPILGVNLGRMGFLSENKPEDVVEPLLNGDYVIEERDMLEIRSSHVPSEDWWPYALNEFSVSRIGSPMLGIVVRLGEDVLPTYWADGFLVSTSSGSTAYSLSAGGPICMPDVRAHIIAPIAPHNLNLRPLLTDSSTPVGISLKSRESGVMMSLDNRSYTVPSDVEVSVMPAPFSLRRVKVGESNFIGALRSRLFWGEDVRNGDEQ